MLDLTTNVTQLYSEVYRHYQLRTKPLSIFEDSLYINSTPQAKTIFEEADKVLREFHKRQGTLDLFIHPEGENKLYLGTGSTQLYKSFPYALSLTYPEKKFLFVERIPYFSGHRDAITVFPYNNVKFQGFRDPCEIERGEGWTVVEWVTSPNNPDGSFRRPEGNPDIVIGDFVFESFAFKGYIEENLAWVKEFRKTGKPFFSFNSASKQFGRTGDRLGYMWLDNSPFSLSLNPKIESFLSLTVGTTSTGLANFLNLVRLLPNKEIDESVYSSLLLRSQALTTAFQMKYPDSQVKSLPWSPTFFVDVRRENTSELILAETNVKVVPGTAYGESSTYVRVNTMASALDIKTFLSRLGNKGE